MRRSSRRRRDSGCPAPQVEHRSVGVGQAVEALEASAWNDPDGIAVRGEYAAATPSIVVVDGERSGAEVLARRLIGRGLDYQPEGLWQFRRAVIADLNVDGPFCLAGSKGERHVEPRGVVVVVGRAAVNGGADINGFGEARVRPPDGEGNCADTLIDRARWRRDRVAGRRTRDRLRGWRCPANAADEHPDVRLAARYPEKIGAMLPAICCAGAIDVDEEPQVTCRGGALEFPQSAGCLPGCEGSANQSRDVDGIPFARNVAAAPLVKVPDDINLVVSAGQDEDVGPRPAQ